jgi:hypothetical protein
MCLASIHSFTHEWISSYFIVVAVDGEIFMTTDFISIYMSMHKLSSTFMLRQKFCFPFIPLDDSEDKIVWYIHVKAIIYNDDAIKSKRTEV